MNKRDKRKIKHERNIRKRIIRKDYKITHKLINLNNNSRKGDYYYIHDKESNKSRYYKFEPEYSDRDYLKRFKQNNKNRRLSIKQLRRVDKSNYSTQLKTRGKIDDWLPVGKREVDVEDLRNLNQLKVKQAYMDMLKSVRLDKDNLLKDILSREENIDKFKQRIETILIVEGEDNKRLTFNAVGKTLNETVGELQRMFSKGDFMKGDIVKLKEWGFNLTDHQEVDLTIYDKPMIKKINNIRIKLIYRKVA